MDNTAPIIPVFSGNLENSTAAMCDFALITDESAVPVLKIIIVVNGVKHKFPIVPGKYKMALFLLYCAVLRQKTSFLFDDELQAMLVPYFGTEKVTNARFPEAAPSMLHLLVVGTDIQVTLALKPGYELPKNPSRTIRRLIEHGWNRHDSGSLYPNSLVPLIRQAVMEFLKASLSGAIGIVHSWDSKIWPSNVWEDRAVSLYRMLDMRAAPRRDGAKR